MNLDTSLYPLLFEPIRIQKVWGHENWLLSVLEGHESVVKNGFLAQNDLPDLVETYLTDLVGERVYKLFGENFPVLVKTLRVNEKLSVQVHPDDETAFHVFNAFGKSEMWYVLDAEPDARLWIGFNKDTNASELYRRCREETVEEMLHVIKPKVGECYYIPAGTVHACGGGITIAEIQESSDLTLRLYDWGREHRPETARDMHLEAALEIIDYHHYHPIPTTEGILAQCPQFAVRLIKPGKQLNRNDETFRHSWVAYLGLRGKAGLQWKDRKYDIPAGSLVFIPAALTEWSLADSNEAQEASLLELYVP